MSNLSSLTPAYLASPFTRYSRGHVGAYVDICKLAAQLHRKYKIVVFSPIAHCHGITMHGDLPPIDHAFWEEFNRPFVNICGGLIVAKLDGWDESTGVASEIRDFKAANKTILYCDPETLELTL